ncbi:hypothetical protein DOTSEDRAFT_37854 [Dothistroma septosporum NZE10]|uniref:Apple domain-containing protein n=1 Tax=Dothistroma septosporum (strain NZE10 / CBS 128990) TaxID=675120 RepID=N1PDX7_DOTSN|nr:hypothetical protein DOTSEDRAFT_37854 [Dothistroma septosporum NZE10]
MIVGWTALAPIAAAAGTYCSEAPYSALVPLGTLPGVQSLCSKFYPPTSITTTTTLTSATTITSTASTTVTQSTITETTTTTQTSTVFVPAQERKRDSDLESLDARSAASGHCSPGVVAGTRCTAQCGTDRPGGDYNHKNCSCFTECDKLCSQDSKCTNIDYHRDMSICYFKASKTPAKPNSNNDDAVCRQAPDASTTVSTTTTTTTTNPLVSITNMPASKIASFCSCVEITPTSTVTISTTQSSSTTITMTITPDATTTTTTATTTSTTQVACPAPSLAQCGKSSPIPSSSDPCAFIRRKTLLDCFRLHTSNHEQTVFNKPLQCKQNAFCSNGSCTKYNNLDQCRDPGQQCNNPGQTCYCYETTDTYNVLKEALTDAQGEMNWVLTMKFNLVTCLRTVPHHHTIPETILATIEPQHAQTTNSAHDVNDPSSAHNASVTEFQDQRPMIPKRIP